jgi:hypothetical protein
MNGVLDYRIKNRDAGTAIGGNPLGEDSQKSQPPAKGTAAMDACNERKVFKK